MLWHLYIRKGIAFVPTVGQTDAGFYMDAEPVYVGPASDLTALDRALKESLERGNPRLPTPTRATFPRPVVLEHAKVKSWSTFEKGTALWNIVEVDGAYKIKRGRAIASGGWEDDPEKIESLPPRSNADQAVERVLRQVREHLGLRDDI